MISEPWPRLVADSGSPDAIHQQIFAEQHSIPVSMSFAIQQPNLGRRARHGGVWKPKSSLGQEKSRKSDWNGNTVRKCKKRKTGGRPWKIFKHVFPCVSMFFHIFPPCYCHFLCFASVLRSQTSSHLPSLSCPTDASSRSKAGMVNLATSRHHKEPLWLPEKWPSVQDVQGLPRNSYSMATCKPVTPSRSAWSGQSGPELSWAVSGSKRRGLNREMLTKQQIYVTGHILLVTSPNW